jgi:AcrR family transcriptional regulator
MATIDQIVDTAVELGERSSWEAVRLHDVAAALGITLDDVRVHFQKKDNIVDAWFERADSIMLKATQASDFPYLTPLFIPIRRRPGKWYTDDWSRDSCRPRQPD